MLTLIQCVMNYSRRKIGRVSPVSQILPAVMLFSVCKALNNELRFKNAAMMSKRIYVLLAYYFPILMPDLDMSLIVQRTKFDLYGDFT